jgi:chromosomal replication initiator protein
VGEQIERADYFDKVSELKSKNNSKAIAQPRQIGMYLCRQLTDASLPEIGREFGGNITHCSSLD